VGHKLTVSHATFSPKPTTLTYRWYRAGKAITGATHSSYKVTSKDVGHHITVRVTAHAPGYTKREVRTASRLVQGH
jgi:hypothetical protein